MSQPSFEVRSHDIAACHRCGGEQYLTALIPHPTLPGQRVVGLCPRCDADDPAAQDLLAYLAIYGAVQADDDMVFARLLSAWMQEILSGVPDADGQSADEQAWRDGNL